MALIICPHCGKTISDTAESCIHCGKNLKSVPIDEKPLQDYNLIGTSKQIDLRKEFNNAFPECAKFWDKDEKIKRLGKISWICIIGGIIAMLPLLIFQGETFWVILGIIGAIVFFVSDVVDILCPILRRRYKKKYLITLKKYQKWLKEKKQINYKVTFNSAETKWKKYFDEINLDLEKM